MLNFLDNLPLSYAVIAALALGLAPFVPEPHIWEKLKMLMDGSLTRPIDMFDLLFHAAPILLLVAKLLRMATTSAG